MFVANHLEFYSDSSGLWLLSWYILSGERAYVLEVALPFSLLGEKAVVWATWSSHNHVSGEFGFWSVVCENEQLVPNNLSCSILMTIPSLSDGGRVCGTKWTQSHQFLTQTNMLFQLMMNHHAVMQLRMMKNNELLMKPLKRRPNWLALLTLQTTLYQGMDD